MRRRKSDKRDDEEKPSVIAMEPATIEMVPTNTMTVISDIKVQKRLGGGNFSDVYKGEWQVNGLKIELSIT